jgi:cytochrome c-type biogenesis protein CcmH/NrfF
MNLRKSALATFACVLLSSAPAPAADGADEARAAQVADQLESPFCPGKTLSACASPAAAAWRDDIRRWVGEGMTTAQIRERLAARAGRDLRFVPQQAGFYWLLPLGVVASLTLFAAAARRFKGQAAPRAAEADAGDPPDDAELDRRLDAELTLGE